MNEQQIRVLVQQMLSANRFQLAPVQRHIHNNIDAPTVFQTNVTFVGNISREGAAFLLPKGWTILHTGTGVYKVTHHLGASALYSVVATPYDLGTVATMMVQAPTGANYVIFEVFDLALNPIDNEFFFNLTLINNTSQTLPQYINGTLT